MKKYLFFLSFIIVAFAFVSCGGDNDGGNNGSDNYSWFSQSDVNGLWIVQSVSDKKATTFKHNDLVSGYKIKFNSDGTCKSTDGMETGWSLESGKIKTFYAKTNEPMFVYTLISKSNDIITVKIEGTLDDDLSAILTVKKIVEDEYVDFGLPSGLKWATRNLGADYSKETGTAYTYQSTNVAKSLWGGSWYVPTVDDYFELFQYCSREWYTEDGKTWCKVSKNGKSITFPCDMTAKDGYTGVSYFVGDYWTTSTMRDLGKTNAILFSIEESSQGEANCLMTSSVKGYIRPVMK